jgi:hypothetical protein
MKGKRMAAQLMTDEVRRKVGRPRSTKDTKPTPKQHIILQTKQEHPNLTTREVAAIAQTDHAHVVRTLQRYGIKKADLDAFKANRGDILAGMQLRLLNSITDADIKKAPMGSRVLAAAQLFDKERLQNDLSTQNLASVHADVAAMKALQDKGSS